MIKFCNKCGFETNRNKKGDCCACQKARAKAWYLANKELVIKRSRDWYNSNRERALKVASEYQKKNPLKVNAITKKWESLNKEKVAAKNKKWKQSNRTLVNIHTHNYRSRKDLNGGELSNGIFDRLFSIQKGKCACCHVDLKKAKPNLDHIVPLSIGGKNSDENIQLLCQSCNFSKGSKNPIDFMQSRGFLL